MGRASFTKLVSTSFHLSRRMSRARGCRLLYDLSCVFCAYKIQEGQSRCFDVSVRDPPQTATFLLLYTHSHSLVHLTVSGRRSPILLNLPPFPSSTVDLSHSRCSVNMKSVVILSALFAAALAAPSPDAVARSLARRKAARAQRAQHSKPRILAAAASDEYNENWAGAVLTGESVTAASGSFPVLKAAVPTEKEAGEKEYTASAWVGLDGYNCNGLWQAGVDSIVESSGETSFYAWYEW